MVALVPQISILAMAEPGGVFMTFYNPLPYYTL
jgi:hypothetical protein